MRIRNIVVFLVCAAVLAVAGYALAQDEAEARAEARREAAREALNQSRYEEAAAMLAEAYELQRDAVEAGNDLYWQAFARYKLKRTHELQRAVELLQVQQERYRKSSTAGDGEALLARLYAELAERGEADAAREVHEMSEDEQRREDTRAAALDGLMRMHPDRAMPILRKILSGEKEVSPEFRRNAVFILCRSEHEQGEDILIDLLENSDDVGLQSEIVMCLAQSDSERALKAIIDLFQRSDDPALDEAAMFALGRHGGDLAFDTLAGIARDPDAAPELRGQALYSLSRTGRDDQVAELARHILRTEDDRQIMEMALVSLAQLEGDVPDQVFAELLENPEADDQLRSHALYLAAQRKDLTVDFVLGLYERAEGRELKMQVYNVISQLDDEDRALETLIDLARQETDPEIRQNAVYWIGQYDDDRAAEFLLEVINQ